MSLTPGATFGPYEILASAGAGGMGEVFRARDPHFNREVALKIVSAGFAEDPDRAARFQREAQVLASLNHPNIAGIYGLVESGGTRALVMEFVPGPTLADRIAAGAIHVADSIEIAVQIVNALEAAHEKGIVHRDLKPANIKVTPEGQVKVLDFGLAKAIDPEAPSADPANSPTITLSATRAGAILGTAAYMAPEQARGLPVDRRADIWAFGAVLYEMLTGRQPFPGETVTDSLAAVLKSEPDWTALPADSPAAVRRLLRRCLVKDRRNRLSDIADARLEFAEPDAPPVPPIYSGAVVKPARSLPWIAPSAVLALALAVTGVLLWRATRAPLRPLQRFDVPFDSKDVSRFNGLIAVAPDGSRLAFIARDPVGRTRLYARRIDQAGASAMPGTEEARDPFFSPDGVWIGFFSAGALRKVSLEGGAPVKICDAADMRGASWGENGQIVFSPDNRASLLQVSDAGGTPHALTALANGEISHRHPQFVLNGEAILYTAITTPNDGNSARLNIYFLKAGTTKTIHTGGYFARYMSSGHMLWMNGSSLVAAAVDLSNAQLRSAPAGVLDNVASIAARAIGHFAISNAGMMVALIGEDSSQRVFSWVDRDGKSSSVSLPPGNYLRPSISPDGKHFASSIAEPGKSNVFVSDSDKGGATAVTFSGADSNPIWTPDGKRLVFQHGASFYWTLADGSSQPQLLYTPPAGEILNAADSFTPDGTAMIFTGVSSGPTRYDLWLLPIDWSRSSPGNLTPQPLLQTNEVETNGVVSPDAKWLAYASGSGTQVSDVYVESFPRGRGKWRVTPNGGRAPLWLRRSQEILFQQPDGHLATVSYRTEGNSFVASAPVTLPTVLPVGVLRNYDAAPDGRRILVVNDQTNSQARLSYLLNFGDELKRRIPAK